MAALDAEIQARPLRHAVFLPRGCSKRTFGDVVARLCAQWGGVFSVVIPCDEVSEGGVWEALLEVADPDIAWYHRQARHDAEEVLGRMISGNRLSPWRVLEGFSSSIGISLSAPLGEREDGERIVVDARAGGGYSYGDAARYGILDWPYKRWMEKMSVRRYRRLLSRGEGERLGSVVSVCARRGPERRIPLRVLFLGDEDSVADACAFWNIRAVLGVIRVAWLPSDLNTREIRPSGFPTAVTYYSVDGRALLGKQELDALAPKVGAASIEVRELDGCIPSEDSWLDWSSNTEPLAFEGSELVVSRRSPEYVGTTPASRWAMDIMLQDPAGCSAHGLQPLLHPSVNPLIMAGRRTGQWDTRVSRAGVTTIVTGARGAQVVRLRCPRFEDVVDARSKAAGLAVSISDKGVYSSKSVELMGGIEKLAELLRNEVASAILDEFMVDHHTGERLDGGKLRRRFLTVEDMVSVVVEREEGKGKKLRGRQKMELRERVNGLVATLLEKRVLQPGAVFDCRACRAEEWYHAREFDDSFVCRRCLEKQSCGPSPDWRYSLHESVFQGYFQRMRAPVMALDSLRSDSETSFVFMSEAVFTYANGRAIEVDILVCQDGELLIGEAKSGSRVSKRSLARYEQVAKELGARRLVFATSERMPEGCGTMNCEECTNADEAFSHGKMSDRSNWGTRETIRDLREKLGKMRIDVETLCPECLERGCRWAEKDL